MSFLIDQVVRTTLPRYISSRYLAMLRNLGIDADAFLRLNRQLCRQARDIVEETNATVQRTPARKRARTQRCTGPPTKRRCSRDASTNEPIRRVRGR